MTDCADLRLGATEADLDFLRNIGVPSPDEWTYTPYSLTRTTGSGKIVGYGYPTATWSWDRLSQDQLYVILSFFAAVTDASVLLYVSTYTDAGRSRQTASDFTAYMHRPVDGDGKEMFPNSAGRVARNVTLTFTHLEAA